MKLVLLLRLIVLISIIGSMVSMMLKDSVATRKMWRTYQEKKRLQFRERFRNLPQKWYTGSTQENLQARKTEIRSKAKRTVLLPKKMTLHNPP